MMKKEIKFSLVYRDMWQSSGKYQPRVDQLVRIAPLIVEMGCCHLSGFSADAGFSGTTGAACRLLALKAKHSVIHCRSSPSAF